MTESLPIPAAIVSLPPPPAIVSLPLPPITEKRPASEPVVVSAVPSKVKLDVEPVNADALTLSTCPKTTVSFEPMVNELAVVAGAVEFAAIVMDSIPETLERLALPPFASIIRVSTLLVPPVIASVVANHVSLVV